MVESALAHTPRLAPRELDEQRLVGRGYVGPTGEPLDDARVAELADDLGIIMAEDAEQHRGIGELADLAALARPGAALASVDPARAVAGRTRPHDARAALS